MDERLSMGLDAEFAQLVMSTPNLRYLNLVDVEIEVSSARRLLVPLAGG